MRWMHIFMKYFTADDHLIDGCHVCFLISFFFLTRLWLLMAKRHRMMGHGRFYSSEKIISVFTAIGELEGSRTQVYSLAQAAFKISSPLYMQSKRAEFITSQLKPNKCYIHLTLAQRWLWWRGVQTSPVSIRVDEFINTMGISNCRTIHNFNLTRTDHVSICSFCCYMARVEARFSTHKHPIVTTEKEQGHVARQSLFWTEARNFSISEWGFFAMLTF